MIKIYTVFIRFPEEMKQKSEKLKFFLFINNIYFYSSLIKIAKINIIIQANSIILLSWNFLIFVLNIIIIAVLT
jgi:hypothetical protein